MKYLVWLLVDLLSMGGNQQELVIHRIEQQPWPVAEAVEVAWCESRFLPTAYNVNAGHSTDKGIFQINDFYWESEYPELYKDVYTIDANIEMAYLIYQRMGGWNPWVCAPK
jgi:hypothetical protein|tara:strand:+ start:754 stop:1086 length:333 start_codon:yes stop_codon:yes gene_type:complete